LGSNTGKSTIDINFLWEEETLWLLELSSLGQFTTLEVLYLDKTWVNQKYIWQDSSRKEGLRVPPGKASKLTVCYTRSTKTGFICETK
jgi:hypothetical protein